LRGFEAMAGVQKIHLKELVDREPAKTGALAKPERRRRSKKVSNTVGLDEQKKMPVYSQSAIGKGASAAGLAQTLAAEAHSSGSALHLSNE
jgi:ABC-type taurine transport system ATPase subunit